MSKKQFTGIATKPQCNRNFCQLIMISTVPKSDICKIAKCKLKPTKINVLRTAAILKMTFAASIASFRTCDGKVET